MKCRTCNEAFHACTNCGLTHDWEYEYCNYSCFKNSKVYAKEKEKVEGFIRSLTPYQLATLYDIFRLENYWDYWSEKLEEYIEAEYTYNGY